MVLVGLLFARSWMHWHCRISVPDHRGIAVPRPLHKLAEGKVSWTLENRRHKRQTIMHIEYPNICQTERQWRRQTGQVWSLNTAPIQGTRKWKQVGTAWVWLDLSSSDMQKHSSSKTWQFPPKSIAKPPRFEQRHAKDPNFCSCKIFPFVTPNRAEAFQQSVALPASNAKFLAHQSCARKLCNIHRKIQLLSQTNMKSCPQSNSFCLRIHVFVPQCVEFHAEEHPKP